MTLGEASPEKAGVGGSIPSLATIFQRLWFHFSFFILPTDYPQLPFYWIDALAGFSSRF
jgi:hypothetical protein